METAETSSLNRLDSVREKKREILERNRVTQQICRGRKLPSPQNEKLYFFNI